MPNVKLQSCMELVVRAEPSGASRTNGSRELAETYRGDGTRKSDRNIEGGRSPDRTGASKYLDGSSEEDSGFEGGDMGENWIHRPHIYQVQVCSWLCSCENFSAIFCQILWVDTHVVLGKKKL